MNESNHKNQKSCKNCQISHNQTANFCKHCGEKLFFYKKFEKGNSRCSMLFKITQQYLDLEFKLEDTIDTIKDNDNPEAFFQLMVQECQICFGTKDRNQVRCFYYEYIMIQS